MQPKSRFRRRNRTSHPLRSRRLQCEPLEERALLAVTITATDFEAAEPANHGMFQITRTENLELALDVNFSVSGSASRGSGTDYVLKVDGTEVSGTTVTIPAGQASVDVALEVINNTVAESTETAVLTLAAGDGYTIGTPASATINIADDEPPVLSIIATDPIAAEPSNHGSYRIQRAGSTAAALSVDFSVGGSAERGAADDYVLKIDGTEVEGTTISLAAGQEIVDVTLEVVDDSLSESSETAVLTLEPAAGYAVGTLNTATVTIADNEFVTITAIESNAAEPSGNGTYRITRTGSTDSSLTVTFAADGTATRGTGNDYVLKVNGEVLEGTTVVIPAGETSVDVLLEVVNDTVSESLETAVLTLSSPAAGYTVGTPSGATVNIADDDPPVVTITATDDTAAEPTNNGTYRITRTGSTVAALAVTFTESGTAARGAGDDYVLRVGGVVVSGTTVTIPAGQASVDVTLEVLDDDEVETTETATLTLSSGTGYTVGAESNATVSIADDNDTPVVTITATDNTAAEPSNNGTYRITRTGSTGAALTVTFAESGTAARGAGGDYVLKVGTADVTGTSVTIPAGQSSVDVTLEVINDTTLETAETAVLTLQAGTGYTVGAEESATVNIADDDTPVVTIAATDAAAAEPSNNGTYRITRTGSTTAAVTVTFAESGTAARGAGGDYVLKVGTADVTGTSVTIPAGQSSVDVTLEVINDTTLETAETAVLTLQAGTGY
ncbi:MAG: hypothetical protein GXY83_39125, partial [Rhodopirellula sp.]|nr:hypothetical protein [Rhodopirellula sp.]